MDGRGAIARRALNLVEGAARGDTNVDPLLIEAFDNLDEAARAHAYLAGFLLQLLAHERHEGVASTATRVRRLLETTD